MPQFLLLLCDKSRKCSGAVALGRAGLPEASGDVTNQLRVAGLAKAVPVPGEEVEAQRFPSQETQVSWAANKSRFPSRDPRNVLVLYTRPQQLPFGPMRLREV